MATERQNLDRNNPDAHPDPITGAPGSHPIGTGIGAAGGGAAGAAIGAAIGAGATGPAAPVGAVLGAVIGAVAGGLAGKGAAEAVNPTAEDAFWRRNYANRPYYQDDYDYDRDYRPAYEYGWSTRGQYVGQPFEDVESDLESGWDTTRRDSRLGWDNAKHAARDAWQRLDAPDDFRDLPAGSGQSAGSVGASQAYPGQVGSGSGASGGMADADVNDFTTSYSSRYQGRSFDECEDDLHRDWDQGRQGRTGKTWDKVKDEVRRAWHKVERAMPGDADRDGR